MWCWSGGRGICNKTVSCVIVLCTIIMVHTAQRYEQFLQVGWLLGIEPLFSSLSTVFRAPVSSVFMVLYIYIYIYILIFCSHPALCLLVNWAWWDWPLAWLTNLRSSVLWHCWFVSKMTYNVLTVESDIKPYYTYTLLSWLLADTAGDVVTARLVYSCS